MKTSSTLGCVGLKWVVVMGFGLSIFAPAWALGATRTIADPCEAVFEDFGTIGQLFQPEEKWTNFNARQKTQELINQIKDESRLSKEPNPYPPNPTRRLLDQVQRETVLPKEIYTELGTTRKATLPNDQDIAIIKQGPGGVVGISRDQQTLHFAKPGSPLDQVAEIVDGSYGHWAVRFGNRRSQEFNQVRGQNGKFIRAVYRDDVIYAMLWANMEYSFMVQNWGTVTLLAMNVKTGAVSTLHHEETFHDNFVDIDIDAHHIYVAKYNEVVAYDRAKVYTKLPYFPFRIYRNTKTMGRGIKDISVADGHLAILDHDHRLTLIHIRERKMVAEALICKGVPDCVVDQVDLADRDQALFRLSIDDKWSIIRIRFDLKEYKPVSGADFTSSFSVSADNKLFYVAKEKSIEIRDWSKRDPR